MRVLLITVLIVVVAAAALVLYGAVRWNAGTRELRARLDAARVPIEPARFAVHELEGLPPPVQRYLRIALREGQPVIASLRMRHAGTFNIGDDREQWRPFTSDQLVVTRRPGFDWDGRVTMMPGLTVRVHDAYVAGEGVLHAAVLGFFTVADLRGTREVAEGELMRFFAECPWYPTALLPSQGVRWEPLDAQSAKATLTDGDITVSLTFTFTGDGLIDTVRAESRWRTVGERIIPTPWQGRFWNYEERDGMRVPMEGEVAWLLPDGPRPYWRGRIADLEYEFAH